MSGRKQFLALATWLLTAIPLAAQTGSVPDEREENRRKLERLKDQPEAMAGVRKKALFFLALPDDRRAQLLDLDHKLHKEPMPSRKRLDAAWLEALDPAERKKIKDAPDSKTRLEIIKKIRADEWLKKQPRALQEEVGKLDGDRRAEKIHGLRDKERKKKIHWIICSRFWEDLSKRRPMPARLSDLDGEVTTFFNEYLSPRLSSKEKDMLRGAEGKWPQYPMVLVAVADRHPPALPDPSWPREFKDLPREVQKKITKFNKGRAIPQKFLLLAKREGLARAVSLWTRKGPPFAHELWPKSKASLSEPVKKFISTKLVPVLTSDEFVKLNQAKEQGWPYYPLMLKQLAEGHDLQVPWHSLPGNPELWDKYRLKRLLEKP